jgi:hypothetical protein
MNQPTNALKIIDLSKMYSKKDIKRELKANGFGSVDTMVFQEDPINEHDTHTVYVWFRPTKKPFVVAKRCELTQKLGETIYKTTEIPVRCAQTPRIEDDEQWCLGENTCSHPDDMKTRLRIRELEKTIDKLEHKLELHEDIIYQLLGGLFHQGKQRVTLESHLNILFDLPQITTFSSQEGDNWPTTRQGDKLEADVKGLKKAMDNLEDKLKSIARSKRTIIVDTESDDECVA